MIQMKGGLDLISPPTNINPGSLFDCLNFEVALLDGYRRIDGLLRFDGRPVPSFIKLYTLREQYDDNEDQSLHLTPLYEGTTYTWPPEGFNSAAVPDTVYYQYAERVDYTEGASSKVYWSAGIKGVVLEQPSFVEVDGVNKSVRTGLVYFFHQGNIPFGETVPGVNQNLYPREAISDSPHIRETALSPGVSRPSTQFLPGQTYGIFNNQLGSYDVDIESANLTWLSYNTTSNINEDTYSQSVKEFPGGTALGMVWSDDKLYAVAESHSFEYSDLDGDVFALMEPGQWCYYKPTYQLVTDGPLGEQNSRSLIGDDGTDLYQHAFCLSIGADVELVIPGTDPVSPDYAQEPSGLELFLLTEVRVKNIVRTPSALPASVNTSKGWTGIIRALFFDDDGVTGTVLLENDSGTLSAGDTIRDSGNDNLFEVVSMSGGSDLGSPLCTIGSLVEKSGVIVESTPATGFRPIDMGWEIRFDTGTNEPLTVYEIPDAEATEEDTGFLTAEAADTSGTGQGWSSSISSSTVPLDPASIEADDGDYAFSNLGGGNQRTSFLIASDLGIDVPALDLITGMEVQIVAKRGSGTATLYLDSVGYYTPDEDRVWSVNVGTVVTNTKETFNVGGQFDTFNTGTPSQPDLSSTLLAKPGFGVAIRFRVGATGIFPVRAEVHAVGVKIYHTSGTTTVWLHDASKMLDVGTARILHKFVDEGTWAGSDAEGVFSMLGDIPELVPGIQVRTAAEGAGTLIANVVSGPDLCRLPDAKSLEANKSQYQFIESNFFASKALRAIYGVSGAGPGFAFNDDYFFFIRTGVEDDLAKPRHVGRLKDRLVFGYDNGNLDLSTPGDPADFDAVGGGAATLGVGDKITGLLVLQGDALAVFSTSQIIAYQGPDNETFQSNVISPSSGAIEYTVVDMGVPVFCDYRGISTISTTEKYGDFERGRLSKAVQSWLSPRLQGSRKGVASDISVAGVVIARNKNQYRVIFRDGKVLTMTLDEDGPQFTFQEYRLKRPGDYVDVNGADLDPVPSEWVYEQEPIDLVATCWGVTPEGQDRLFLSAKNYPYILELDRGTSFDGQAIESYIMLNLGSAGDPRTKKRLNGLHVFASVRGYANLTQQVGADYALPSGRVVPFLLGDPSSAYYSDDRPAWTKTRTDIEGRDFLLKIAHESLTEQPFTLQAYSWPDASQRKMER